MLNHDCSHLFMLGLNSLRSTLYIYIFTVFSFYVFFQYMSTYVKDMVLARWYYSVANYFYTNSALDCCGVTVIQWHGF